MSITQAVILAGGKGERLRPLTDHLPKPMVKVGGKPFAHHLIELLKQNGIKEVIFLTGYLGDKINDYFGDGSKFGLRIKYSSSPIEYETGSRVLSALPLLQEKFLLLYGDNYWPLNLKQLEKFYDSKKALVSMTVYKNLDAHGEYGPKNNLKIAKNKRVTYYGEHAPQCQGLDIGFFIVNKKALRLSPSGNHMFQTHFLPEIIKRKGLFAYETDHPYHTITNIDFLKRTEKFFAPKKAVFLDRDGVINENQTNDYVKKWSEFKFLPDAVAGMKKLSDAGYQIYVITNQRGISLKLMSEHDLEEIHSKMKLELAKNGISLSGIYYCPHDLKENCLCRKPKAGMLYQAAWDHNLDLTKSFMVGDTKKDIDAGMAAGCQTFMVNRKSGLSDAASFVIKKQQN